MPPEHPVHSIFSTDTGKHSPVGKKSSGGGGGGSGIRSLGFNLFTDYESAFTSQTNDTTPIRLSVRIYELNNLASKSFVKTVYDSGVINMNAAGAFDLGAGDQIISDTTGISANNDTSKYYGFRIEHEDFDPEYAIVSTPGSPIEEDSGNDAGEVFSLPVNGSAGVAQHAAGNGVNIADVTSAPAFAGGGFPAARYSNADTAVINLSANRNVYYIIGIQQ